MFVLTQRWYSEGEPELGLGIISKLDGKQVTVFFPLAEENRIYNAKNAPLKRFALSIDDDIKLVDGTSSKVKNIEERNNLYYYLTVDDQIVAEQDIHARIELNAPLDRLLAQNFDEPQLYNIRYQSYLKQRNYQQSKYKGLLGSSIRLIPHQIYITQKVLSKLPVRAMLCDEVGLGKTIEAGLILNSLIKNGLSNRCLIIVPSSLVYQWFAELYKKFHLSFSIYDNHTDLTEIHSLIIGLDDIKSDPHIFNDLLSTHHWDTLIIDESHQNNYDQQLAFLKNLKITHKILLSATPEILGFENLFHQLNFLDPLKYSDLEKFKQERLRAIEISNLIKNLDRNKLDKDLQGLEDNEVEQALIDRYGSGRAFFRNSRSNLDGALFKSRLTYPQDLELAPPINDKKVFEAKFDYLYHLIDQKTDKKFFVVAHSKNIVLKIAKNIQERSNRKIAVFHSDQSLIERDRQAAYFADPEGAQILVCTEVGTEGRNFEFCHHMILFDLPTLPDQLEQRIGRLDRIGQKNNINIFIPYIRNSFEEILFRYFDEVYKCFDQSPKGASEFHSNKFEELNHLLKSPFNLDQTNKFIKSCIQDHLTYLKELEEGRDFLVEKNSFDLKSSQRILQEIDDFQEQNPIPSYLKEVCEAIGIKYDELNDNAVFLQPLDNMYLPSFPGLPSDGQSYALNRDHAILHDQLPLLSWETPVISGALDLFLNSSVGNCTLISAPNIQAPLLFELIFVMQTTDKTKHLSQYFLPLTPLRILIAHDGQNKTTDYPKKFIDENSLRCETPLPTLPKDQIKALMKKAHGMAIDRAKKYKLKASEQSKTHFESEMNRVKTLKLLPEQLQNELEHLKVQKQQVEESIKEASIEFDSLRVIFNSD